MNKRERILLGAVCVIGIGFAGQFLYSWVKSAHDDNALQIESLTEQLEKKQLIAQRVPTRTADFKRYLDHSLSSNPLEAKAQYTDWITKMAKDRADLLIRDVQAQEPRALKDTEGDRETVYDIHTFKVIAVGNLRQVTRFLHEFYSVKHLHRIRDLTLTPKPDRKDALSMTCMIDALSLREAPADKKLEDVKSERPAHGDLKEYETKILARNLFGPPNEPPSLRLSGSSATIDEETSLSVRMDAGERGQKCMLELVSHDFPEGAEPQVDSSGRLKVYSKEEGRRKIVLRATDNGMPAKSVEKEFMITFRSPPPAPKPAPPRPEFDKAKVSFYTAYVESGGVPEAWIRIRIERETKRIHEGEDVRIGSVEGKVTKITPAEITIKKEDGSEWVVRSGEALSEGKTLTSTKSE